MKIVHLSLIVFIPCLSLAQHETIHLDKHRNLIGGTWKGEGKWQDGTPFKLHIQYQWGLSGKLIKTKTFGNTKQEGYEFGLRNEGIQVWDPGEKMTKFWEFDIFGGITQEVVFYNNMNFYFSYDYHTGDEIMELTDGWEYVNGDTYEFKIGVFDRSSLEWKRIFLSTQMKRFE